MKLHLAVDAVYELPISMYVTTASSADSLNLIPLLEDARDTHSWFSPESVLADRGYDALHIYKSIAEDFNATPIIPIRARRKGATKRRAGVRSVEGTPEIRTALLPRSTEDHHPLPIIGSDDASEGTGAA